MAGWSRKKRVAFEKAFYNFLNKCYVNSKDYTQPICLGEHLYWGQRHAITMIFDGLEDDIHDFYFLKARQLGITTIIRAYCMFYLGLHNGLKGALVFDTAPNREEARAELVTMIKALPLELNFPAIKGDKEGNREGLTLINESKILFKNAGVKKSKGSGTLGRSVGLALAHMSELCSYDNDEGLEAFEQSLSDINPDRLYIKESTARGYNKWWNMWRDARADTAHKRCIFLGWWSKESQQIARGTPDFRLYGETPPSEKEAAKIKRVKELYGFDVSVEQLAWIRRKMDPTATASGDAGPEYEGSNLRIQEQPWVEEEAFQQTGSVFFTPEKLTDLTNKYVTNKYQTYMFLTGLEFVDMEIVKSPNSRSVELKVWEEPDPKGEYVLACDPAFGENVVNDRSSIQVLKCYADGVDQVAEYAWPLINTRQLAWVIAALLGWYGANNASIRYILEMNGPGGAVFNELRSLKHQLETNYNPRAQEKGLSDVFRNVRTFIFQKNDALSAGLNYHFKTNPQLKVMIMERMRDFVTNGMLHCQSLELVEEMKTIQRDENSIKATGSLKDDRVLAMALALHCWEERVRKTQISRKETREAVAARKHLSMTDQVFLFQQNQLSTFFQQKAINRHREKMQINKANWRYRRA